MRGLALFLCDEGELDEVARIRAKFPTGALAEFELARRSTAKVQRESARLLRFVRPKGLSKAKELGLYPQRETICGCDDLSRWVMGWTPPSFAPASLFRRVSA